MRVSSTSTRLRRLAAAVLLALVCLAGCGQVGVVSDVAQPSDMPDTTGYLVSPLDEPDTTDFQCTTINYTVALNVFDRLVETKTSHVVGAHVVPSLAKSWEVSDDGCTYTFHLRDDVSFSNGSELTASDVHYSLVRLLTHPDASNQDIAREIVGAQELEDGKADDLEGFTQLDDYTFQIRLARPYAAFLSCLSMPGASIMDEQTTQKAGERFGKYPAYTVGTGPFVFEAWYPGDRMLFAANPDCWSGAPACAGLDLRFEYDPKRLDEMCRDNELDVVNLDDLGDLGEYYLHGNAYASRVRPAPHVGIDYIALNESVKPLDDVRVRKALQLALNRQVLLEAALSGSGTVENGIYPHGLTGFNAKLPAIPYDLDQARELLAEAGYEDGFDLQISMRPTAAAWQRQLMDMVSRMWARAGVRANVVVLSDEEFMAQRTSGQLACYMASWAADFNDPDNFIYTFFGTSANSVNRSLCYADEEVMARVRKARYIQDNKERIREYRDLERKIVQDDAAWIPLFSRERHFLVSDRMENFTTAWNGWAENVFSQMSLRTE